VPAPIDRNGVLILIRSTLIALDEANKTGNYTVLRDLGSPGFQVNTAARLAEIFVSQRKDNIDLSGVAVLEPQLTVLPQIEANGMMRMAGFFPSVPTQVNLELMYAPVDWQWRLFGISVSLGQSARSPRRLPSLRPPHSPKAKRRRPAHQLPEGRSRAAKPTIRPPGRRRRPARQSSDRCSRCCHPTSSSGRNQCSGCCKLIAIFTPMSIRSSAGIDHPARLWD
jgi:hypothetical protein